MKEPAVAALLVCSLAGAQTLRGDEYELPRKEMVREIEADVRRTARATGRRALSPSVVDVMGRVPRHEFVPSKLRSHAYENRPLSIGYGQTISQPYIVAIMTELLDLAPDDVVLEIGTGSGYQAAVLAEIVRSVYTIEIVEELGRAARERLKRLGYSSVEVRLGDGYYGWKEHGPFDAIIVTAAASQIPPPLIDQLQPQGTMIIPVGSPFRTQHLTLIEKSREGKVTTRQVLPVAFVPLTRKP